MLYVRLLQGCNTDLDYPPLWTVHVHDQQQHRTDEKCKQDHRGPSGVRRCTEAPGKEGNR